VGNTYISNINLFRDGENVDQKTMNPRMRALINNIDFIKQRLDEAALSRACFLSDVTCEETLNVGQPAFYNQATQQYEQAIAETITTDAGGVVSAAANVVGLCYTKVNSTKCTLLIAGTAQLSLDAAVTGDVEDGEYYLSGSTAGMLVQAPAAIAVPVAQKCGEDVIVSTNFADVFARHQHLKYSLLCAPAGEAEIIDDYWEITGPDDEAEGWLPADNVVFGDKAPAGAKFGYNLAVSGLGSVWPPVPTDSVFLEWHKGDGTGGYAVPLGDLGLCIIDRHGIWWMSDCLGDVPWLEDYGATTTTTTTTASPVCPRFETMQLFLYFTHLAFQTDVSAVLSLQSTSPMLRITCVDDGLPATTGHLQISLDLSLAISSDTTTGGLAIKGLDDDGHLLRGPVVEGVKSANSSLVVAGTHSLADGFQGGLLTLTALLNPLDAELSVQNIQLEQVREESPKNVMALMFPIDMDSAFSGEIHIPAGLSTGVISVGLRFWLLGDTAGTLPDLELLVRTLPTPTDGATDLPDDTADVPVLIDTAAAVGTYQYVERTSEAVSVAAGDTIQFQLIRTAATNDGYAGNVYVMKMLGVVLGITNG